MVHLVPCSSDTEGQANRTRREGSAVTGMLDDLPENWDGEEVLIAFLGGM